MLIYLHLNDRIHFLRPSPGVSVYIAYHKKNDICIEKK